MNNKIITLTFSREEALACAVALVKDKPYKWRNQALVKVDKAMGFNKVSSINTVPGGEK